MNLKFLVTEDKNNSVNAVEIGRLAAKFFCQAESLSCNGCPFTWFFIRPPWSPSGTCCKASVYNSMVDLCNGPQVRLAFFNTCGIAFSISSFSLHACIYFSLSSLICTNSILLILKFLDKVPLILG